MTDIIELIDNAIEDYETSDDAMRWAPEPVNTFVSGSMDVDPWAGWRERAERHAFRPGESFHNPPGRAIDFMLPQPDRSGLRDWLLAHAGHLSISEVIWGRRRYVPRDVEPQPEPVGQHVQFTVDDVAGWFDVPRDVLMFGNAYVSVPVRRTRAMHVDYSRRLRARRRRRRS